MKNNPDYIQYQKELEQELDKKAQIVELLNIYGSCSIVNILLWILVLPIQTFCSK